MPTAIHTLRGFVADIERSERGVIVRVRPVGAPEASRPHEYIALAGTDEVVGAEVAERALELTCGQEIAIDYLPSMGGEPARVIGLSC